VGEIEILSKKTRMCKDAAVQKLKEYRTKKAAVQKLKKVGFTKLDLFQLLPPSQESPCHCKRHKRAPRLKSFFVSSSVIKVYKRRRGGVYSKHYNKVHDTQMASSNP
jgi:hypothetical protein